MRNAKITESSEMLKSGTMSAIDFINKIRHNDDNLCRNLTITQENTAVIGDDECELEAEIEVECRAQLLTDTMQSVENDEIEQPSTSNNSSLIDELEDEYEPNEGACITCLENVACVVFLDCSHNAVCASCYEMVQKTHVENCNKWYADDPRKLKRELKRMKCPKCNQVASNVIKIRSNSFK